MSARFVLTTKGLLAAAIVVACGQSSPAPTEVSPSASASESPPPLASFITPSQAQAPTQKAHLPNPLGLPPHKIKLDPGRRVFTFSESMLANAKLGSTLVLYAATVAGFDGDDLVIEGQTGGPSYKVHAGYVIPVPDGYKPKLNEVVLTEWNGVMKHAIVKRFVKDRIAVKYTDMDGRAPEALLKGARFIRQTEGLAPGNYAALKQEGDYKHVLLISPLESGEKRWFCLGFGGAAMIVSELDLVPIPIKWKGKPNQAVWAEWAGSMRRATLQAEVEPGVYTVKFERAGKPETVGFGLIMDPL